MADYRCPKHDVVFQAETDMRRPGSAASDNKPAMPVDCHVDCPGYARDQRAKKSGIVPGVEGQNPVNTGTGVAGTRRAIG